jgi:hypothetical protein
MPVPTSAAPANCQQVHGKVNQETQTMVCTDKKQCIIVIPIVLIQSLTHDTSSKNDSLSARGKSRHLTNKIKIVLARNISKVNRPTTNTSGSGMKARVIVNCLEHIPIWNYIQMLCKQGVMRICEDMPWMAGWDFREEVVRVSDKKRRSILGHLRVEEYLRRL